MGVISYRSLKNWDEFNLARIVSDSFYVDEMKADVHHKNLFWDYQKSIDLSFLVGAFEKDELIGVIRMIPTTMSFGENKKSSACITSVVVKKEFRGQGVSRGLMECAISILEKKNIEIAYLFARRAVDNFYNKFGFVGLSSYENVSNISLASVPRFLNLLEIRKGSNKENISKYNNFYEVSYKACFGKIDRGLKYWENTLERVESYVNTQFIEIYEQDNLEGYAIISDESTLLEVSCSLSFTQKCLASLLSKTKVKNFSIPHNNILMEDSNIIDATISYRRCVNGGHMVKIIGEKYDDNVFKLYDELKDYFIGLDNRSNLIGRSLSFNFSWPDQL